jgi:hypothetical protein
MEINKRPWPLATVCGVKNRIDTNPDFQRPAVWSLAQKQLLMDSIIRGYDVPKFYWRIIGRNPDRYDVVDGQQRLRAIWEFHEGLYALPKDAEPLDGADIAKLKYSELPDDLRMAFDTYPIDVILLSDTDEDEVREMFLRLQNGTSLKAQEKRNAMPGNMRSFVKALTEHPFFLSVAFANSRYAHDHVAAQITLIELNGEPCNIKNSNLNAMYKDYAAFDANGAKARKILRVLKYLRDCFPTKTPELERYSVISLYAVVSHLSERYVVQDRQADLAKWFLDFEAYRRTEEAKPEDESDQEMVVYHERISHSTDAVDSLTWRHEFLMRKLFQQVQDFRLKDNQRVFSHEQRLAIFRRDNATCQVKIACAGEKCEWDNWEADHKIPWSGGGPTTVENGQVACIACNRVKAAA